MAHAPDPPASLFRADRMRHSPDTGARRAASALRATYHLSAIPFDGLNPFLGLEVDFEVANWFTATHRRSPFTQNRFPPAGAAYRYCAI